MALLITTETGSKYEFSDDRTKMRRVNEGGSFHEMREDGKWVTILNWITPEPVIGENILLIVDVRHDGIATYRTTSRITEIENA